MYKLIAFEVADKQAEKLSRLLIDMKSITMTKNLAIANKSRPA